MEPVNVSGLELARRFFFECVQPLLSRFRSRLPYAAALIGHGSEVLGFDDSMSRDHHWGPRLMLFLSKQDRIEYGESIDRFVAQRLPYSFLGYPTNFSEPDPSDNGTQLLREIHHGPVRHRVEILDVESYLLNYLGITGVDGLTDHDWLTFPQQKLRSLVGGDVFHDDLPAAWSLQRVRSRLAFYPRNPWLYQMAACWARIGQEEHLMGRAGLVGDEVGSAIIGSRLVRDIMRLLFLVERTYAPYAKWLGTAFKQLRCGMDVYPILRKAVTAVDWQVRETALVEAYQLAAVQHNALDLTAPLSTDARRFFSRPFRVLAIEGFSEALLDAMEPEFFRGVMRRSPIGGIDHVSDNTDFLEDPQLRTAVRSLYE
jgi:hypothetical protein